MKRCLFLSRIRTVALAGLAALATACASSPTPAPVPIINARNFPTATRSVDAPPVDLHGWPDGLQRAPEILNGQPPSECVPYARNVSGVEIYGDAVTWWRQASGRYPQSHTPAQGSVLVLRGWQTDKRGHVAVVSTLLSQRVILVDHANWLHGGEISVGVPVLDVSEANDWSEVRVWYIPGAQWGGRIYRAEGFIHPIGIGG
jgi:hypothetical protein